MGIILAAIEKLYNALPSIEDANTGLSSNVMKHVDGSRTPGQCEAITA